MKSICLSWFLLTLPIGSVQGSTHYVPDDFPTIQGAIGGSLDGDSVIVRSGTYVENINFLGKAIVVMSESGPAVTTINGSAPSNPDSGSVVIFVNGEGPNSVLDGFTLTRGKGTRDHAFRYGGGIYCEAASPTITHNTITDPSSVTYGGGVYCRNASPLISDNRIVDNSVQFSGAGIYCSGSTPTISNNTISENRIGGGIYLSSSSAIISGNVITDNSNSNDGGGIGCFLSSPTITSNVIQRNSADSGGGISCDTGSPTISNNVIADNSVSDTGSHQGGGGLYFVHSSSAPTVTNNVIEGNSAAWSGGGIHCSSSHLTMIDTIVWNNVAPVGEEMTVGDSSTCLLRYSDVQNGPDSVEVEAGSTLDWGAGMLEADPLFADSDYRLQSGSPCIDAGDPALLDACLPPGLGGTRGDIGAYGGEGNCGWPSVPVYLVVLPSGPVAVAGGDTLRFSSSIRNTTADTISGDFWLSVRLPSMQEILIPQAALNDSNPLSGWIAESDSVTLSNEAFVPAGAVAGNYSLIGRIGVYPNAVLDEESFDFWIVD